MSQSIIEYVNTEYRKNIKLHQEQAQPLVDFLQQSIDAKYKQEEAFKVRGQQVATAEQQVLLETGEAKKFTGSGDPKLWADSFSKGFETTVRTTDGIKTTEERGRGGNIISKKTEGVTPTEKSGTYYDRVTGDKLSVTFKDGVATDNFGKKYNNETFRAKFTETAPLAKDKKAKAGIRTFTNKAIDEGLYQYVMDINPDANEKTFEGVMSKANSLPTIKKIYPTGKYKDGVSIDTVKDVTGSQQLKQAIKRVRGKTIDDITIEIDADIKAELDKKQATLDKEIKKRKGTFFGGGRGSPDEKLITKLTEEIKILKTRKTKEERVAKAQAQFDLVERIIGKKGYTPEEEAGIERVMKAYPNKSREEVINLLIEQGKLK